jgi:hypothetical protein
MKTKNILITLAAAVVAAGCASTSSKQTPEKPPPKANRVQVLRYDTTTRPATTQLDICGTNAPGRPYKIIAFLTCEGAVDQEVVMTTAIYYRARQLGADAVMNAGAIISQNGSGGVIAVGDARGVAYQAIFNSMGVGGRSARCVFQKNAIVYTDK